MKRTRPKRDAPVALRPELAEYEHLIDILSRSFYIRNLTSTEFALGLGTNYTHAVCRGNGQLVRYETCIERARLYAELFGLTPYYVVN